MTVEPQLLTGRTVLAIALGAFGVIIGVNLLLAYYAVATFSGLVVPNSYVASQTFDHDRDAQDALGWTVTVAHGNGELRIGMLDATGATIRPQTLTITVGRPASAVEDVTAALEEVPGGYAATLPLARGDWRVEIAATAADGTLFKQRRHLFVTAP